MLKKITLLLLFAAFSLAGAAQTSFAKYLYFLNGNPAANTIFDQCHPLSNQTGYLLLANRYVNTYRAFLVTRTDAALQEIWTRKISFQLETAPFDNTYLYDIGELANGNYYVFGQAADLSQHMVYYVVFLLSPNGMILQHTVLHETIHPADVFNIPTARPLPDGGLLIATSEVQQFGFYRLDQNLSLVSSGFYKVHNSDIYAIGHDALFLSDSTLLLTGESNGAPTLTKTDGLGTVIWSHSYTNYGACKAITLYEAADHSLYMGGHLTENYTNNMPLPCLAHLDSAGNMLWLHTYEPNIGPLPTFVRNLYPTANGNLLLQTDSLFFAVDMSGTPVTWGFSSNQNTLPEIKRAANGDFVLFSMLYQDSAYNWMPTIMRFRETDSSGCWRPRSMAESIDHANNTQYNGIQQQAQNIVVGTLNYRDTVFVLDYRLRDGCPPSPLGIDENSSLQENFSIYPNPANDAVILDPLENENVLAVDLYDQTGRLVQCVKWNGKETLRLPTADLSTGVYIVTVEMKAGAPLRAKLCVQH